jgi:hypothetical protein
MVPGLLVEKERPFVEESVDCVTVSAWGLAGNTIFRADSEGGSLSLIATELRLS